MSEDLKMKKEALRAEATRARSLLSLSVKEEEALCSNFFDKIPLNEHSIVGAYWPKGRELDTQSLIDECLERDVKVSLPVIEENSRILKFARWRNDFDLVEGKFGVCHPILNENTEWLDPDIFLVPLLAFDRRGTRLGYGGGYYDTTLAHYKKSKEILTVGLGYAKQACLFNLPAEEHDIKMDWIVTEQSAQSF